jgi:hypothetical protein
MVLGNPMGISFLGTAFSEPTLIKLASGYEAFTQVRAHNLPKFLDNTPSDHIRGMTSGQEIDAAEAAKRVEDTDTVDPAKVKRKPQGL